MGSELPLKKSRDDFINDKSIGEEIESIDDKLLNPKADVCLAPDGGQVEIDINGTTLNATKNSISINIGNFSITIKNRDNTTTSNRETSTTLEEPLPILATAILSAFTNRPLHIVTGEMHSISANVSLSKSITNSITMMI